MMRMKSGCNVLFGVLLIVCLGLTACDIRPLQPARDRAIGTVRSVGPAAFFDRRPVRNGETLYNGSRLETGSNSSVTATFNRGGFVQLNQNTDPTFEQFFQAAKCFIRVALQIGEIFAESSNSCAIETEAPNATVTQHSGLNIRAFPGRTEITVIRGSATLAEYPNLRLRRGEQITIGSRGVISRRTLTPRQLRAVVRWRERYRFSELLRVPDLRQSRLRDARRRLRAMNLNVGEIEERADRQYRPGTVISQQPRPGSRVRPNGVVNLVVAARSVNVPPAVNMPRVIGRQLQDARRRLAEAGVRVGRIERRTTRRARANTVLEQRPRSGTRVSPGVRAVLVIEAGSADPPRTVTMPSVIGRQLEDAQRRLAGAGIKIERIQRRTTRGGKPNIVLEQRPRAGTRVPRGTRASLVVETNSIIVPSLKGRSLSIAKRSLSRLGLRVGQIGRRFNRRVRPDTVLEQRPLPGTRVTRRTRVNLTVATPYPNVR